jgi:hypothetical protein
MPSRPLNDHDFEEATVRIAYEMYHFRCLARIYRDGNSGRGLWWQLVSQSLLLHLRILIEFFYWDCRDSRDVTIRHFVERDDFSFPSELYSAPLKIRPVCDIPGRLDEMSVTQVKEALDQRLVHFGKGRWNGYHPGHDDYERCFDELECRIVAFRTALPDHLKRAFDLRLSQFEEREKNVSVPIHKGPVLKW